MAEMRRLDSLTSARFFAALVVLASHTIPAIWAPRLLDELTRIGYIGVGFFFALSGLVLTWSARPSDTPRQFWRRRFARVWPLHLLTTMIAVPIVMQDAPGYVSPVQIVLCLLLVQAWVPATRYFYAVNGPSWSLSAEAFFYALTPSLLRRRVSRPAVLAWRLAGLAVLLHIVLFLAVPDSRQEWATYVLPLAGLPAFLCGHLLGRALRDDQLAPVRPALAVVVLAVGGAATVVLSHRFTEAGHNDGYGRGLICALVLPGSLLVIAMLAQRDLAGVRTGLRSQWLVRLGAWSFALYLIHQPIIRLARVEGLSGPWCALGLVIVAIAASGVLHELIERPLERRLRHAPERVNA